MFHHQVGRPTTLGSKPLPNLFFFSLWLLEEILSYFLKFDPIVLVPWSLPWDRCGAHSTNMANLCQGSKWNNHANWSIFHFQTSQWGFKILTAKIAPLMDRNSSHAMPWLHQMDRWITSTDSSPIEFGLGPALLEWDINLSADVSVQQLMDFGHLGVSRGCVIHSATSCFSCFSCFNCFNQQCQRCQRCQRCQQCQHYSCGQRCANFTASCPWCDQGGLLYHWLGADLESGLNGESIRATKMMFVSKKWSQRFLLRVYLLQYILVIDCDVFWILVGFYG